MISRRLLLGGAALALAACQAPMSGSEGFHGTELKDGWELPDVELTDQDGYPYHLRTGWNTPAAAIFFGYLNCPDVCPGIMADMAAARRRMDDGSRITLILITTDPARDTPEALKEYLARVDADFVGLTGDLDLITAAASQLHIAVEEGKQLPSGGYEVDHSTQILGFGSDRRTRVVWTTSSLDVAHLREDFTRLAG